MLSSCCCQNRLQHVLKLPNSIRRCQIEIEFVKCWPIVGKWLANWCNCFSFFVCYSLTNMFAISILTNISSGASTMQKIPSVQGRWHPSSAAVVERVRKAATKSPAEGSLEFWGRRVLRPGQSHKNHSFSERLFFFFLADALNRCD